MDLTPLVINTILSILMFAISGVWMYFFIYMIISFRKSPSLKDEKSRLNDKRFPKVSVILPARNEEKYISRCLDSLLVQTYPNYEIVVINDCSSDRTAEIIKQYSLTNPRIIFVNADKKPDGWAGKNWACYQGYRQAAGDLLLFTDADTQHNPSTMSDAVNHLLSYNLDALTAIPRLICNDLWTKITLPMLSIFLHTRFSPLRVNNPSVKTGYFFGSFFIMTKAAYELVGTHKAVKEELVEDGALGGRVKEAGLKMKMVRGEEYITAIWARDLQTLWHGLRRLVIPIYKQDKKDALLMAIAIFFLLFEPFLVFPLSAVMLDTSPTISGLSSQILFTLCLITVILIFIANAVQLRLGTFGNILYALGSPVAGAFISLNFISSVVDAARLKSVSWRDRHYVVKNEQRPLR